MEKNVNIGAIGVGAFMARQHLPNMMDMANVKIRALCDLDKKLLERRNEEYCPEYVTDEPDDMFKDSEIDIVLIGTRSDRHAHFILEAAKAGKNIYVEKPMTMNMEETREVLREVKSSSINLGIGYNRRFAPSMVEAKKRFQSYKKGSANIYYRIVDDHRIRPHYIFDMNNGGGHLLQEGCHIFDLLPWFLEAEPVEVYCSGPLETDNVVVVKFDDSSIATIICGGKGGLCYPKECMEVFCDNRTLVLDHFYEMRYDGPDGNVIKHFPKEDVIGDMTDFYQRYFDARPEEDLVGEHAANGIGTPSVNKGHKEILRAFVNAVAEGERFSVGVSAGARATICALKAYESIERNIPVKLDPAEWGR